MFNAIFFYRISRWCFIHHIPFIPKLITLLIFLIYNSKIPYQASIGKGTKFGYGGMGVVIHSEAVIGCNCTIGPVSYTHLDVYKRQVPLLRFDVLNLYEKLFMNK